MTQPLWTPSPQRVAQSNLAAFIRAVNERHGLALSDYDDLWRWSVTDLEAFWEAVWDHAGVIAGGDRDPVLVDGNRMPGARFYPNVRLNYAENLLRPVDDPAAAAIVFQGEDGATRQVSHRELRFTVARLQHVLRDAGVTRGERVAGFLPNVPETVMAMLATTSLGAVWSSCSPDFGVQGVLDRFGQIEPKVLFVPDGYYYNGKVIDSLPRVAEFAAQLPSVRRIVVVPCLDPQAGPATTGLDGRAVTWPQALAQASGGDALAFERVPFDHPLYVMFSSGTTGQPKCIVHGVGGTLLQHLKEHRLLCDVHPGDRVFYFTTCGWMMWNWLVTALASRATLLLFDGSPFAPDEYVLWRYAESQRITFFGTSAKYLDALRQRGARPREHFDLSALRTIASTGSPLVAEGFDYVYEHVKEDVCLSSISGGTDIVSCFVGGNPIGPVYRGEIQRRGLGMAVEVWNEAGESVREQKGELVCTRPFVSMPVGFWNDPDGSRYRAAYFERFPGVWCHGDFMEITEHDGCIIHGRSDATLNPGGVRIGTAEIYRQVEKLPEVVESLAIGQEWEEDVRVVLFVQLAPGHTLTEALVDRIRRQVREGASPRHVPARVLAVPEMPRTRSGKLVELAVREVVHGRDVKNQEALANPGALAHFADREELRG